MASLSNAISQFCATLDIKYLEVLDKNTLQSLYEKSQNDMNNRRDREIAKAVINYYDFINVPKIDLLSNFNCNGIRQFLVDNGKNVILKRRAELSIAGYKHDMLSSGTQKNIRRNNTRSALWTAIEWFLFSCADAKESELKGEITNLRKRLMICYLEDVGAANVALWKELDACIFNIAYDKAVDIATTGAILVNIVSKMSQSYHTRLCSYLRTLYAIYSDKQKYIDHQQYLKHFPYIESIYDYIKENETPEYLSLSIELQDKIRLINELINNSKQNINLLDATDNSIQSLKASLNTILARQFYIAMIDGSPACFYYALLLSRRYVYGTKLGKKTFEDQLDTTKTGHGISLVFKQIERVYKECDLPIEYVAMSKKWYEHISHKEAFLAYFMPLMVICFNCKHDGTIGGYVNFNEKWKSLFMYNLTEKSIDFQSDFVHTNIAADIHTNAGKNTGLTKKNYDGIARFVEIGSYVENEFEVSPAISYTGKEYEQLKNYYKFTKILFIDGGGYEKARRYITAESNAIDVAESSMTSAPNAISGATSSMACTTSTALDSTDEQAVFKYIARPQVTTSVYKFDSYLAVIQKNHGIFNAGETVFVKGPIPADSRDIVDILKLFIKTKKILNLPYVDIEDIYLTVSNPESFFGEIANDGLKKSNARYAGRITPNEKYLFLIYKNLCRGNIATRIYGRDIGAGKELSAAWRAANAKLVDFKQLPNSRPFSSATDLLDDNILLAYVFGLYFRYLFGIVDHADRNFMMSAGILYSVDEENISIATDTNFSNLTSQKKFILNNWQKISSDIDCTLRQWRDKLINTNLYPADIHDKIIARLDILINNPKNIFT